MSFQARVYYSGDGTTNSFVVPFPYILESDVALYVNGSPVTTTWIDPTHVKAPSAPVGGSNNVLVIRTTAFAANKAVFQAGAVNPADLNLDALQLLFLIQELQDQQIEDLRAPLSDPGLDMTLPAAATRAGKYFTWASNGQPASSNLSMVQVEAALSGIPSGIPGLAVASTVANLRLITAIQSALNGIIFLEGFYGPSDGGQGFWIWSASSTATDDTGTVINPTGHSGNGRWVRVFDGPIHDLWYGVKADGSTDNLTILQAVEDAASALGRGIRYPWQPNERLVSGTITTYAGVNHYGDGRNDLLFTESVLTGLQGSVIRCTSSSNIPVFSFQSSTGTYEAVPGPSWREMNIHANGGSCIILNSAAGGFTDDLTSQAAQEHVLLDRVGFYANNSNATALVAIYKVFNSVIRSCTFSGANYNLLAQGSDNLEVTDNGFQDAGTYEVELLAGGMTFGNMAWIRGNVFEGNFSGSSGCVSSSYRSTYIEDNYFEPGNAISVGLISLGGGAINATIKSNEFPGAGGPTPNTVVVSGVLANLELGPNKCGGAIPPAALFNAGAGMKAYYNVSVQAIISGGVSAGLDNGVPFFTQHSSLAVARDTPPISGQAYWTFNPNISPLDGSAGSYYTSVMVAPGGFYVLPAIAGTGSQIGWTGPFYSITDTVDVWVFALATVANQTLSLVLGGTTYTHSIAASANPVWYKVASAVAVTAVSSLQVYNADTTHGGNILLGTVKVMKT